MQKSMEIKNDYKIIFEPNITEILKGETQIIKVYKYVDGFIQDDNFVFIDSCINDNNYEFKIIDNNSFSITGLDFSTNDLIIVAVSRVDGSVDNISVKLKGLW